jgi:NADH dehydrogenase
MEVPQSPGMYVLGDCGYLLQDNGSGPYPATHQVATRQGPACARNIIHVMRGESQRPFRYKFKGQIIYLGRNVAVAQIMNRVLDGFTAGMLRRISYLWQVISYLGLLTGFRSKVSTLIDWSFSYFYDRYTARME